MMSDPNDNEKQTLAKLNAVTQVSEAEALKLGTTEDAETKDLHEGWSVLQQEMQKLTAETGSDWKVTLKRDLREKLGEEETEAEAAWIDAVLAEQADEGKVQLTEKQKGDEQQRQRWGMASVFAIAATAVCVLLVAKMVRDAGVGSKSVVETVVKVIPLPQPSANPREKKGSGAAQLANSKEKVITQSAVDKGLAEKKKVGTSGAKVVSKSAWNDPLDARISKVSAKIARKPAALAGVMDHSLQKLDKRVAKLVSAMAQEKL